MYIKNLQKNVLNVTKIAENVKQMLILVVLVKIRVEICLGIVLVISPNITFYLVYLVTKIVLKIVKFVKKILVFVHNALIPIIEMHLISVIPVMKVVYIAVQEANAPELNVWKGTNSRYLPEIVFLFVKQKIVNPVKATSTFANNVKQGISKTNLNR